jgi:alkanesulfonate monooxygenase SsuD/methylene tetrahydromethanopterin reductase-like flavin-dependent oxidoreductase (luciferase family)
VTAARALMVLTENWTLDPRPSLSDLVDLAVQAEAAGVDGVMVSDHVVLGPTANENGEPLNLRDYAMPGNQDPATPWPSPYVLLAAIASRTTSLRLVLGAIVSPLRHPLITAKDLGTLDLLGHGRLVVLPTVSWHRDEYAALGVDFHRRGEILDEHLVTRRRRELRERCDGERRRRSPIGRCRHRPVRFHGATAIVCFASEPIDPHG